MGDATRNDPARSEVGPVAMIHEASEVPLIFCIDHKRRVARTRHVTKDIVVAEIFLLVSSLMRRFYVPPTHGGMEWLLNDSPMPMNNQRLCLRQIWEMSFELTHFVSFSL